MALCTVSGTFLDPQSAAISGATVRFNIESPVLDSLGDSLVPKEATTTTASNGTWSLAITQGISGSITLDLSQTPSGQFPIVKYTFAVIIPSATTATFASVVVP